MYKLTYKQIDKHEYKHRKKNQYKKIVHNFWRGMKILGIYPNVGHSKSGRKLSPRVENVGHSKSGRKLSPRVEYILQ